jgi:hypothetical protein
MMHTIRTLFIVCAIAAVLPMALFAQGSTPYETVGLMNGNQVRTIFGNWGVIGQPAQYGHRGAWKNDNNGYLGDVSPLVGAEVKWQGKTWHAVVTCPVNRPSTAPYNYDPRNNAHYWTWEPLSGYYNPNNPDPTFKVAMSNKSITWPPFWPDKLNDATDPGWRGSWNGYFGKKISADLETYFVMNDQAYEKFNVAANNSLGVAFKPDSTDLSRNGLGLRMSVRAMQWSQFLAKDNIFWLYEITNTGTTTYDRAVFGMLVGTYVGVTSTEDYHEYADDWSFYDVTNNITYTGDFGRQIADPLWVGPVGMVGYAFLESPGNPFDGIDNDGDADSSTIGLSAPQFSQTSFDSVTLMPGQQIVLINDDYSRQVYTIPNQDSVKIHTLGLTEWIHPGKTKVAEGNVVQQVVGTTLVDAINPNAYDGVDNNFNGLIDENYYVHYHQIKWPNNDHTKTPLIDILRPVRYVNYVSGAGMSPYSMIDERRDDRIDNNHDWDVVHDDVGRDGIPNTGDYGEGDGLPTSGYDNFGHDTGLPGEPHIDKTDVRESDQIGLTSFYYFTPASQISLGDDEGLWNQLKPGFFSVPKSIVNNKPVNGEDGDFTYGSGFFPLLAKETERFSLALVYGGGNGGSVDNDIADLLKNKKTVQKIYDANYQFPTPPDRPTLTAVPGDHEVTLYWDRKSEASVDPVLLTHDFEGYKLYKSTSPDFSDIFTVTDGSGAPQGYKPLEQWDLVDSVKGYFPATGELYQSIAGYAYDLGSDNGLVHSFVDNDVQNGQRYFYALVAYDRGDAASGILPSENKFTVSILPSGQLVYDPNVAVVTPNPPVAGYVAPDAGSPLDHTHTYGTGSASYEVLDPRAVTGHNYQVEFLDTQVDGIDNNGNGLIDAADSTEWDRRTSFYSVRDLQTVTEQITGEDTSLVRTAHENLIGSTVTITNAQGAVISPSAYLLDTVHGSIRGATPGSFPKGTYALSYQYYPVYHSPNIEGTPFLSDSRDADAFDGVSLLFKNDWRVTVDTTAGTGSRWVGRLGYQWGMTPLSANDGGNPPRLFFNGYPKPANYRVEFSDHIVDTSYADPDLYPIATPVNFRIYNETDSTYIKFIFVDARGNGVLSPLDELVFVERDPRGKLHWSWDVNFASQDPVRHPDSVITFSAGDMLLLKTKRPFRQGDVFQFTTVKPTVDDNAAAKTVFRVRAVPNPYVTASTFEPPLNPGVTSGRGERKIEFIHVPRDAKIRIFTARGDYIVTLYHASGIDDGTVSWNLKTSENLDIAYGVYFYVVESPVGTTTGKLAIIK